MLVLAVFFAGWNLSGWPVRLAYPGEELVVEGMRLAEIVHLREGIPIYAPSSPEGFDASIYGPLYYLLGAQIVNPKEPSYFPLRLLSTLGTLGLAAGCALLAYWLSGTSFAASLACLMFLGYSFVAVNGVSARPDMVALLLAYVGFLVAYRFRTPRGVTLAAVIMVLSFFYKQQFVAAPSALLLCLLYGKRFRLAARFVLVLSVCGLGSVILFQFVIFSGQDFLLHFVNYNLLPFELRRFEAGLFVVVVVLLLPILADTPFLCTHPNAILAFYIVCSVISSLIAVGKAGSGTNYFIEPLLVIVPVFAALVAASMTDAIRSAGLLCVVVITLLAAEGLGLHDAAPEPADFAVDRTNQDFLRRNFAPGTPGLDFYTGDLLRAGLATPISDPYQYTQLICKGALSGHDLLEMLNRRRFGVIILHFDLASERSWPHKGVMCLDKGLGEAILGNYLNIATLHPPGPEKRRGAAQFYIWVPRLASGSSSSLTREALSRVTS